MPRVSQYPEVPGMDNNDYFLIDTYPINQNSTSIVSLANVLSSSNAQSIINANLPAATPIIKGVDYTVVYNVRDYGAKIDGSTNDTSSINAAIIACSNAGGGIVFIPAGITRVTTIVLQSNVTLEGAGRQATIIYSLSATNAPVITNFVSPDGIVANGLRVGIRNLRIDGHLFNSHFSRFSGPSGAGNTSSSSHGIFFNTNPLFSESTNDAYFDSHQLVEDVEIWNCAGWGFFETGRCETRLKNVYTENCVSGGISPSFDTFLWGCSSGANSGPGFSFTHGNITAAGCKSFLSGKPDSGGTIGNQPGFVITGIALACTMVGCIAQNNNAQGFYLLNASGVTLFGNADSNNFGIGNTNTAFAGVELKNSFNNIVEITGTQGFQSGAQVGNQYSVLRVNNNSDGNNINVTQIAQSGYTAGPVVSADSVYLNNLIVANGLQINPVSTSPRITSITSSATPSLDTDNYNILEITALAVDITSMTTNLSGSPQDGASLIVRITDNGTGRAISWGSSFEASGTISLPTTTTPAVLLTIGFLWNTVTNKWHIVGVS